MSDIEELRARAEDLGVKVDGRWGVAKLREVISDAESHHYHIAGSVLSERELMATINRNRDFGDDEPEPVPGEVGRVDDGWPKRVAPRVWLDQQGRRYTELGAALRGAEDCRR